MRNFISEKMSTIGLSGIRKVNEKALAMERAGKKVIHFEIGRPDFDTPEYIKKAAVASLDRGEVFYTSNLGDMGLREAIAEKLNKQNHIPYKAENIMVSVGLSEAIFDALMAILDEGDELLVPDPVWMNYINVPKVLGAVPVSYTLKEENGYQMDLDEIRRKITDRTKLLVPLCLVEDGKADCALVLDLQPSGAYRAAALLSLPRAYACARVISREQPSWLSAKRVL